MRKKSLLLGLIIMFIGMVSLAFAEDVFVTQVGTKYHKETCKLVKNKEAMTQLEKSSALEKGYGACRRCYKEDIGTEEQASQLETEEHITEEAAKK